MAMLSDQEIKKLAEEQEMIEPFVDYLVSEENGKKTEVVLDNRVYSPFINLNKKDIASMYADLKIMEVFLASRSCEDATHIGTHCGKCWWCDERKWAFGYLE